MSTVLGLRSFNRSQKERIGGKALTATTTALVNIDSKRVQRDLARHSAIGAVFQAVPPFFQNDDGVVDQGGKVSTRATGLVLDVAAVNYTRGDGTTKGSGVAGTATVGTADATNPRTDTIVVDTTAGTYAVIAGTAIATANAFNVHSVSLSGRGAVPANRIVLAYVIVPATATNLASTAVVDARP